MKIRYIASVGAILIAWTPAVVVGQSPPAAKATAGAAGAPRTPWGTPDLQGIWGNEKATPFERPNEYGTREFLTDAERAVRKKQLEARAEAEEGGLTGFRDKRKERGTNRTFPAPTMLSGKVFCSRKWDCARQ